MICERCHGHHTIKCNCWTPEGVKPAEELCPRCGGAGVTDCCDGESAVNDPPEDNQGQTP